MNRHNRRAFIAMAGVAALSFAFIPVNSFAADGIRQALYVSLGGGSEIAVYTMHTASGKLDIQGRVQVGSSPGSLAADPSRKHLYVAIRGTGSVATLAIDPQTGWLTPKGTTQVAGNPVYVTTDHTGRQLLTAYYSGDKAAIYPIGADGVPQSQAGSLLNTYKNPHSILVDPSNRFVLIPNTGADRILQFRFDPKTGSLEPNEPAEVVTAMGDGPRHFTFHPAKPFVYFVNEKSSSITAFRLDKQNGTLTALQTLTTLPANFEGKNTCADIHVTPDGNYLYASNRGHDSLAGYAINAETGRLTPLGQTPTEKTPREFEIDATGNFLYSAGQNSDRLAAYRIDSKTGRLQPLETYEVGKGPAWVLAVKLP